MKVAVLINPSSNLGYARRQGERLLELLKEYPIDVEVFLEKDGPTVVAALREACEKKDIDAIFAVGGDGTVHMAVEASWGSDIPIGIIAVGSGNDLAREFRLPVHNIEASTNRMVDALFAGRTRTIDTIEIKGGTKVFHALSIVCFGFDAAANEVHNRLTWPNGTLRWVRALYRVLRTWEPYGLTVEVDGKRAEGPVSLLSIANTRFYGGGMNIAPDARPDDGILEMAIGCSASRWYMRFAFPLVFLGKAHLVEGLNMIRGRSFKISDNPVHGMKAPIATGDGEIIDELPLEVTCIPNSLRILI